MLLACATNFHGHRVSHHKAQSFIEQASSSKRNLHEDQIEQWQTNITNFRCGRYNVSEVSLLRPNPAAAAEKKYRKPNKIL